jgi:DNA repair exonuclease SbcCD nuclease subunit
MPPKKKTITIKMLKEQQKDIIKEYESEGNIIKLMWQDEFKKIEKEYRESLKAFKGKRSKKKAVVDESLELIERNILLEENRQKEAYLLLIKKQNGMIRGKYEVAEKYEPTYKIIKDDKSLITKIIHIADIHIHVKKYHMTYMEVFNTMYNMIKAIKDTGERALIVIAGDIFHEKGKTDVRLFVITRIFLEMMSQLYPVIIIAGNHDTFENKSQDLDTISGVLVDKYSEFTKIKSEMEMVKNYAKQLTSENKIDVHYLRDSGVYQYNNIIFGVSSLIDNYIMKKTELENILRINNNPILNDENTRYVALYHGMVRSNKTPRATAIAFDSNPNTINITTFDGYDLTMLGDIHIHYYLNDEKTIAYPSSLISHNFSECDDNHGFILWSPIEKTSEYKIVENKSAFRCHKKEEFKADNEFNEEKIRILLHKYPKAHLKIISKEGDTSDTNILTKMINDIYPDILLEETAQKGKVKNNTHIQADDNDINELTVLSNDDMSIEDIHDKINNNMREIIKECVDKLLKMINRKKQKMIVTNEMIEYFTNIIANIHDEYNIKDKKYADKWTIEMLYYDNLFTYGEGNIIDFSNYNEKIVGMNGNNRYGKTSFLDIITYAIYGTTMRSKISGQSLDEYINRGKKGQYDRVKAQTGIILKVGTSYFYIYRSIKKKLLNKAAFTDASLYEMIPVDQYNGCYGEIKHEYKFRNKMYKMYDITTQRLKTKTNETQTSTLASIIEILGCDCDTFIKTNILNGTNEILQMSTSAKREFLINTFGINFFERAHKKYTAESLAANKMEKKMKEELLKAQNRPGMTNKLRSVEEYEYIIGNDNISIAKLQEEHSVIISEISDMKMAYEIALTNITLVGSLSCTYVEYIYGTKLQLIHEMKEEMFKKVLLEMNKKAKEEQYNGLNMTGEAEYIKEAYEKYKKGFMNDSEELRLKIKMKTEERDGYTYIAVEKGDNNISNVQVTLYDLSFNKLYMSYLTQLHNLIAVEMDDSIDEYLYNDANNNILSLDRQLTRCEEQIKMINEEIESLTDQSNSLRYINNSTNIVETYNNLMTDTKSCIYNTIEELERMIYDKDMTIFEAGKNLVHKLFAGVDILTDTVYEEESTIVTNYKKLQEELSTKETLDNKISEKIATKLTLSADRLKILEDIENNKKDIDEYVRQMPSISYNKYIKNYIDNEVIYISDEMDWPEIIKHYDLEIDKLKRRLSALQHNEHTRMMHKKINEELVILNKRRDDICVNNDIVDKYNCLQNELLEKKQVLLEMDRYTKDILLCEHKLEENANIAKIKDEKAVELINNIMQIIDNSSNKKLGIYLCEEYLKNTDNNYITMLKVLIKQKEDQLKKIILEINDKNANIKIHSDNLLELRNKLQDYENAVQQANEMEILKILTSDEGIQYMLLDKYITIYEGKINSYTQKHLNKTVKISLNTDESTETSNNKHVKITIIDDTIGDIVPTVSGMEGVKFDMFFRLSLFEVTRIPKPKILLVDEQTSKFDKENIEKLPEFFETIREHYSTILMISHDENVTQYYDKLLKVRRENNTSYIEQVDTIIDITHIDNIYPLSLYDKAVYDYNTFETVHEMALKKQNYILEPLKNDYNVRDIIL